MPPDVQDDNSPKQVPVKLNPNGTVRPIAITLRDTMAVLRVCIPAIQAFEANDGSLDEVSSISQNMNTEGRLRVSFRPEDNRSAEVKSVACVNWLLSKTFQDLARAVRSSLEEAYLYTAVVALGNDAPLLTVADLRKTVSTARKTAQRMSFPALMRALRKELDQPLQFEEHFNSFQRVRNCLEHRDGIVGKHDTKETDELELTLPRYSLFYTKDGQEIEVEYNQRLEAEGGKEHVEIYMRMTSATRSFKQGERVQFSVAEIEEICLGCWAFAVDLSAKLPRPRQAAAGD